MLKGLAALGCGNDDIALVHTIDGQELERVRMAIAAAATAHGKPLDRCLADAYDDPQGVDQGVLLDDALCCVQVLKFFWQRPQSPQLLYRSRRIVARRLTVTAAVSHTQLGMHHIAQPTAAQRTALEAVVVQTMVVFGHPQRS